MLVGLIGAPNQGKSTFFNALTLAGAEVASHAFTTIKPNEGVAHVKVKSLREDESPQKGYSLNGYRFIPFKVLDVAGLVPGASEGKGLGNQFMNDLINADAFIIVVDVSGGTDEEGSSVEGHDPSRTVQFILDELDAWIYGILSKHWEAVRKKANPKKLLAEKLSGIGISEKHLEQAMSDDLHEFATNLRKLSKPFIIAANKIDKGGDWKKLEALGPVIPTTAVIELMLRKAAVEGFIDYVPGAKDFKILKELSTEQKQGLEFARKFLPTGIQDCINKVVFELLKLKVAYPVMNENKWTDAKGNILPDAFLIPEQATAIDLAYKVHTDIGDHFIRAVDCKTKKIVGKEHVLKDSDVIKIISK